MRHHKEARQPKSAQAVEHAVREVVNQTAKLREKAEELRDSTKRVDDIHHEIERTLEQAKQIVEESKRQRPAA